MQYRLPFVLGLATLSAAGAFAAACSSTTQIVEPTPDGSSDTSTLPDSGPGPDVNKPDTSKGPIPECTSNFVKGPCDLVSQNCTAGQECVFQSFTDGGEAISCQPPGTGAIVEGDTCTANSSSNPCVAGLECQNGRCSRHCCPSADGGVGGDSTVCGTSKEGYPGVCDLVISDAKLKSLYMVCEYNPPCEPFQIQPCTAGNECIIRDTAGTATCQNVFGAGLNEGQTCMFANACKDGMLCIGSGMNKCTWVCYKNSSTSPPFDAGGLTTMPAGKGGCPMTETCGSGVTGLPSWVGLCQ